eukprot:g3868.t1
MGCDNFDSFQFPRRLSETELIEAFSPFTITRDLGNDGEGPYHKELQKCLVKLVNTLVFCEEDGSGCDKDKKSSTESAIAAIRELQLLYLLRGGLVLEHNQRSLRDLQIALDPENTSNNPTGSEVVDIKETRANRQFWALRHAYEKGLLPDVKETSANEKQTRRLLVYKPEFVLRPAFAEEDLEVRGPQWPISEWRAQRARDSGSGGGVVLFAQRDEGWSAGVRSFFNRDAKKHMPLLPLCVPDQVQVFPIQDDPTTKELAAMLGDVTTDEKVAAIERKKCKQAKKRGRQEMCRRDDIFDLNIPRGRVLQKVSWENEWNEYRRTPNTENFHQDQGSTEFRASAAPAHANFVYEYFPKKYSSTLIKEAGAGVGAGAAGPDAELPEEEFKSCMGLPLISSQLEMFDVEVDKDKAAYRLRTIAGSTAVATVCKVAKGGAQALVKECGPANRAHEKGTGILDKAMKFVNSESDARSPSQQDNPLFDELRRLAAGRKDEAKDVTRSLTWGLHLHSYPGPQSAAMPGPKADEEALDLTRIHELRRHAMFFFAQELATAAWDHFESYAVWRRAITKRFAQFGIFAGGVGGGLAYQIVSPVIWSYVGQDVFANLLMFLGAPAVGGILSLLAKGLGKVVGVFSKEAMLAVTQGYDMFRKVVSSSMPTQRYVSDRTGIWFYANSAYCDLLLFNFLSSYVPADRGAARFERYWAGERAGRSRADVARDLQKIFKELVDALDAEILQLRRNGLVGTLKSWVGQDAADKDDEKKKKMKNLEVLEHDLVSVQLATLFVTDYGDSTSAAWNTRKGMSVDEGLYFLQRASLVRNSETVQIKADVCK